MVAAIEFMDLMNSLKTYGMSLEEIYVINKKSTVVFTTETMSSRTIQKISEVDDKGELQKINVGDDLLMIIEKFNAMVRKMNMTKGQIMPIEHESRLLEYQPTKQHKVYSTKTS